MSSNRPPGGAGVASAAAKPASKIRESDVQNLSESELEEADAPSSQITLTDNQYRMLFLISLYTYDLLEEDKLDKWFYGPSLRVFIHESIVSQVFDYDYGPSLEGVEDSRQYLNVSYVRKPPLSITQAALSDLQYLVEQGYIQCLKGVNRMPIPSSSYRITEEGVKMLSGLRKVDMDSVNEVVYAPGTKDLLHVDWTEPDYFLSTATYHRRSTITDSLDLPFVSSAYVPQALRHGGRPTLSNAYRIEEVMSSEVHPSRPGDRHSLITLNSVSFLVAECIPWGTARVYCVNQSLSANQNEPGGWYNYHEPLPRLTATTHTISPGYSSFSVLDSTVSRHINMEGTLYPQSQDPAQVESFGVSVQANGSVFYGMQIEAIQDKIKDNICLGDIARMLVQMDSSLLMDSLLNESQKQCLNIAYPDHSATREKITLLIGTISAIHSSANEINPHYTADEYLSKTTFTNELRRLLGSSFSAYDISEHDTLLQGQNFILLVGPNSRHHEPLLCAYLHFRALSIFLTNYQGSLERIREELDKVRLSIAENPVEELPDLSDYSHQLILHNQIVSSLGLSIDDIMIPPEPPSQAGRNLFEKLQMTSLRNEIQEGMKETRAALKGTEKELYALRDSLNCRLLHHSIESNNRILTWLSEGRTTKTVHRLLFQSKTLLFCLTGLLAFALLYMVTGSWTVVDTSWMKSFYNSVIRDIPMLWLIVWALFYLVLHDLIPYLSNRNEYTSRYAFHPLKSIPIEKIDKYLSTRKIFDVHKWGSVTSVSWKERCDNLCYTASLEYHDNFVESVIISFSGVPKRQTPPEALLNEILHSMDSDLEIPGPQKLKRPSAFPFSSFSNQSVEFERKYSNLNISSLGVAPHGSTIIK